MTILTGRDIVEYRHRRGLTVEEFANIINLTPDDVKRMQSLDDFDETTEALLISIGVIPTMPAPTPAPTNIRKFSNSEIQAFKRCRRKWWLGWYRGLAPKQVAPVGVVAVGARLHLALESGYLPGGPYHDKMLDTLQDLIREDRKLLEIYDDETKHQFESEADLERRMLSGYVEWLEETGADSDIEVLASETYVERHIPHRNAALIGKLDVQIKRNSDGKILFIDHKSVGSLTQPTLHLNEQLLHYMTLLSGENLDNTPSGGLYNMLKRSKRTDRAKPPFYARIEVLHNFKTLEAFWVRLMGVIDDITLTENALKSVNSQDAGYLVYPTPSSNCSWDCPFFKICPMFDDGSRVEDAINDQYEVINPLSYYERKETNVNSE